ncbi:unnamed protein product [Caenorhabditis nigoni]
MQAMNKYILILFVAIAIASTISEKPDFAVGRSHRAITVWVPPPLAQRLARIINGVSLEIGLTDGTITSDAVISEILHMGPVKPSDVINMDSALLKKEMSHLNDLVGILESSNYINQSETRLVLLEDMREAYSFMKTYSDLPGKTEYAKSLEELKTIGTVKNDLVGFQTTITYSNIFLNGLKKLPEDATDQDILGQKPDFQFFEQHKLKETETKAKELDSALMKLRSARTIREQSKFIDILFSETELRSRLKVRRLYDDNHLKSVKNNFRKVSDASEKLINSLSYFKSIQSLTKERKSLQKDTQVYTCGFPGGALDVEKLTNDMSNYWIRKHIKYGSIVCEILKESFDPFKDVTEKLKQVNTAWIPLDDPLNQKSFESILSILLRVEEVAKNEGILSTTVDSLRKCDETLKLYPTFSLFYIEEPRKSMDALNVKLGELRSLEYADQLKNLGNFKADFDTTGKSDEAVIKMIRKVSNKLKTDERYKNLFNGVSRLLSELEESIKVIDEIPNLVSQIDLEHVEAYHKDINTPAYLGLYKCLSEIPGKALAVKRVIETVEILRNFSSSGENVIMSTILDSRDFLKTSVGSLNEIRKINTQESMALKTSFPNYKESSRKLGIAVQGLQNIQKVRESREKLKPLLEKVEEIQKAASGLEPKDQDALKKLSEIKNSLISMFSGIDSFLVELNGIRVKRVLSGRPGFRVFEKVFQAAGKIASVQIDPLDMKDVKEAMKKLNTAQQSQFSQSEDALKVLEGLNLDSARFGFLDAVSVLKDVDNFFTNFHGSISAPKSPIFRKPSSPSDVIHKTKKTPGARNHWYTSWWFITIPALIIASVAGCLVSPAPANSGDQRSLERAQKMYNERMSLLIHTLDIIVGFIERASMPYDWFNEQRILFDIKYKNYLIGWKRDHTNQKRTFHFYTIPDYMPRLVGFEDPYIFATEFEFDGRKWITTQSPMDGREWVKSDESNKVSTIEKYFALVDQLSIVVVAQLNPFENAKGERLCARFYGDKIGDKMIFGRYTVETIEVSGDFEGFASSNGFSRFTLQITNSQNNNSKKKFAVLRYAKWKCWGTPREPEVALDIIKFCDRQQGNVLVQSLYGVHSSGTLLAIKNGVMIGKEKTLLELDDVILPIRNKLPGAVATVKHIAYLALSISKGVMIEEKVETDPNYDKMYFIHLEMRHDREYREAHLLWHDEKRKVSSTSFKCEQIRLKMVKYPENLELQCRRDRGEMLDEKEQRDLETFEKNLAEDASIEEGDPKERLLGDKSIKEDAEGKKKEVPKGEKVSKNSKSKGSKSSKDSKDSSGGSKVSKASNPSKDSKPSGPSKSKKTKREPQKLEKAGKTQDMED